ncbi:MAG: hypothetical protein K6U74_10530 [Firmicutes bacterium]|nr:hypothetical protein [Bacillota bacterium]
MESQFPEKIAVLPPNELSKNIREALLQIGYGCLPVWTGDGCSLFVRIDRATAEACRNVPYAVRLELHEVDGCPLLRLGVTVYDRPSDPLRMDCFLNVQNEHDLPVVKVLVEQERLIFHWYDEALRYVHSAAIRWCRFSF